MPTAPPSAFFLSLPLTPSSRSLVASPPSSVSFSSSSTPLASLSSPSPRSSPSSLSLLGCFENRVLSQDLAQFIEAVLHLGDAGQLGLQPLLLLGEGEARCRVQLLEAPASLAVELQQVGVVLPGGGDWE